MKTRATIKDVAREAGVGTSTVTRVVCGTGYVSDEARIAVLAAVRATDYRANSLARTLRRRRSNVIGHVLQSTVPNPFFVTVARGVETQARARGYSVMTFNVQRDVAAERHGVETLLAWNVDAVIFTTPLAQENVEFAGVGGVPVVQVERPRSDAAHMITVSNYPGALVAMRHLIDLGHRAIAYLGAASPIKIEPLADYVEAERLGAYRDAMRGIGQSGDDLLRLGPHYPPEGVEPGGFGYREAMDLLKAPRHPTAILCSNDLLAAAVLQAAHDLGLRVPQDLSVVGFDDTIASFLSPPLTTVRLPARDLGRLAVDLAIDDIEAKPGPQRVPRHETLLAEFILRRSTAAPFPA